MTNKLSGCSVFILLPSQKPHWRWCWGQTSCTLKGLTLPTLFKTTDHTPAFRGQTCSPQTIAETFLCNESISCHHRVQTNTRPPQGNFVYILLVPVHDLFSFVGRLWTSSPCPVIVWCVLFSFHLLWRVARILIYLKWPFWEATILPFVL